MATVIKGRMADETARIVAETLKEEGIDLYVTMPEEPTTTLTEIVAADSHFQSVIAAGEGHGIALCAGAAAGGRRCVFVTGIAGLMVGTWALAQMTILYSIPLLVLASYRGDFSDRTGVPGRTLLMFHQVGEPLLKAVTAPYRVANRLDSLKRDIKDAHYAARGNSTPVVLLLSGEVLW